LKCRATVLFEKNALHFGLYSFGDGLFQNQQLHHPLKKLGVLGVLAVQEGFYPGQSAPDSM
jgi:hypothetical protein